MNRIVTSIFISLVALTSWNCSNMSPSGDMEAVLTGSNSGLEGGSNRGTANLSLITTCADTQVLVWDDVASAWECSALGGVTDGDKGDITASASGATWTIDNAVLTLAKMADVATARIFGRVTAGTGVPEALTGTQATTLLDLASTTTTTKGLVPGGNSLGSTYYFSANGTYTVPPGAGDITAVNPTVNAPLSISDGAPCSSGVCAPNFTTSMATGRAIGRISALTGVMEELTSAQMTANFCDTFATGATTKGCVPGSNSVGSTYFLNGAGAWAVPAGGITNSAGNNVVTKSNGTNVVASTVTDDGSTWAFTTPQTHTDASNDLAASRTMDSSAFTGDANVGAGDRTIIGKKGTIVSNCSGTCTANDFIGVGVFGGASGGGYTTNTFVGIYGTDDPSAPAYPAGFGTYAGYFDGAVNVEGSFTVNGAAVTANYAAQSVSTTGTINDQTLNAGVTTMSFTGGSAVVLNGLTGGADGRCVDIVNSLSTNAGVVMVNEAGASTAVNRIITSGSVNWEVDYRGGSRLCYESADGRYHHMNSRTMGILSVAGAATFNGGVTVAGGTFTTNGNSTMGDAVGDQFMISGLLFFDRYTNGASTAQINSQGYSAGTTQTRSIQINDGTGTTTGTDGIAFFDGVNRELLVYNTLEVDGASQLDGATTFNSTTQFNGATNSVVNELRVGDAGGTGKLVVKDVLSTAALSTCGTAGHSIVGDRTAFTLTLGSSGTVTPCTVNYADFTNTPICTVSTQSSTKSYTYTKDASVITITGGAASQIFDVICVDRY